MDAEIFSSSEYLSSWDGIGSEQRSPEPEENSDDRLFLEPDDFFEHVLCSPDESYDPKADEPCSETLNEELMSCSTSSEQPQIDVLARGFTKISM